MMNQIMKYCAN
uniref:Uncharacterized protein n=1 Tax=Arundo donax TaxID=35708 RepID=A0A0A8ZPX8_ARUDO